MASDRMVKIRFWWGTVTRGNGESLVQIQRCPATVNNNSAESKVLSAEWLICSVHASCKSLKAHHLHVSQDARRNEYISSTKSARYR